jgi:Rrf2 family cysteine metabolism transcriptional repressor
MLELAENYKKSPIQLKNIAQNEQISIKYLEQLMAMLKTAGIVSSVRGSKGGYVLAKPPGQIRLSDCYNCLEGPVITVECVENEAYCNKTSDCTAREIWTEIHNAVMAVLKSLTLQDILDKKRRNKAFYYQI